MGGTVRVRGRVRVGLLAAGAVALAAPAAASAALAPVAPQDIATGDFGYSFAAAAGSSNQAGAIWTGQNNGPTVSGTIRPAGGPSGPMQTLSFAANAESPRLLFEPGGSALGLWSHATSTVAGEYAVAPLGGAFSAPRNMPSGDRFADVAEDGSGRAVAVWKSAGATTNVVMSSRAPGGAFLGTAALMTTPVSDAFIQPSVAANAGGQALAAWSTIAGAGFGVYASLGTTTTLPNAGAPIATNVADVFSNAATAIGPTGDAAVLWSQSAAPGIYAAFRAPGGALGTPALIIPGEAFGPAAVFDAAGTMYLAWVAGPNGARVVRFATRPSGGALGAPVDLSPAGSVNNARIALDAAGDVVVTWTDNSGATAALVAAERPAGASSFSAPVTIASGVRAGATAVTPDGNVFAAWSVQLAPDSNLVRVGGLDNGTPPSITSLVAPTGAIIGTPAAFSVAASDWSGLGQITWQFGDGATATGAEVTHAYAAAGAYTVTVSVPDGAGNVATATRRVEVPAGTLGQLLDRVAPKLTTFTPPKRITRAALLRPGLTVRVRSDEAASATVELMGSYNGRALAAKGKANLLLATRTAGLAAGRTTSVRIAPRAALIGTKPFRATVRITLRDVVGNTSVVSKTLPVTVPKPKPKPKPKAKAKPRRR